MSATRSRCLGPRGSPGICPRTGPGSAHRPPHRYLLLGVVLFESLAGRVPYDADTTALHPVQHISSGPLGAGAQRRVAPEVGPVVERALAKEPDRRYQHAGDLAAALYDALTGATASLARPRRRERVSPAATVLLRPVDPAGLGPTTVDRNRRRPRRPNPAGGLYPPTRNAGLGRDATACHPAALPAGACCAFVLPYRLCPKWPRAARRSRSAHGSGGIGCGRISDRRGGGRGPLTGADKETEVTTTATTLPPVRAQPPPKQGRR